MKGKKDLRVALAAMLVIGLTEITTLGAQPPAESLTETVGAVTSAWRQNGDGTWIYQEENGQMAIGWKRIDGHYYYFEQDGIMRNQNMTKDETVYSIHADGSFDFAKKEKNTGGGEYQVDFLDEQAQWVLDGLNEIKREAYYEDFDNDMEETDHNNNDTGASLVLSGKLTEIADKRLAAARKKGYGNGTIPGEGTITDDLKAAGYVSSRTHLEVYLQSCEDSQQALQKFTERYQEHEKRNKHADYYKQVGIAHTQVKDRHYFLIIFMR